MKNLMDRPQREQVLLDQLRDLLQAGKARTQNEVRDFLENHGVKANQPKISRLLHKLSAVKSKNEKGDIVYRLPKEPAPPSKDSPLDCVVLQVAANEHMIVVRTSPGAASLVARLLDYHREDLNFLGSIAGDDTIFIVPESASLVSASLKKIKQLLLG